MPNRIIKESICRSDSIDGLSWFEEVLFYRLIVSCDDYGRFDGRPAIIKNCLFPLKENLTIKAVADAIKTLASKELVALYEFEGKPYLCLPTWNEHQTTRATKSKYPAPEDGNEYSYDNVKSSENICKQMNTDAPDIRIRNSYSLNDIRNSEDDIRDASETRSRTRFVPPSLDDVSAYCLERGGIVDPHRWYDYYSSNGWRVGKNPMKDWKAAVRTWERNGVDRPQETKPKSFAQIWREMGDDET